MKVLIESNEDGWLDNKHPYVSKLVEAKYHIAIEEGMSYIYLYDINEIFNLTNILGSDIVIGKYIIRRSEYNLSDDEKEIKIVFRLLIYDGYLE